jgi:hypothetical protein
MEFNCYIQVFQTAPAWRRPVYYSLLQVTPLATCHRRASIIGLKQYLDLGMYVNTAAINRYEHVEQQQIRDTTGTTALPQERGGREAPGRV